MRFPGEWSQMEQTLAHHLPHLRPAQRRGVTLWVYGTLLAQSACQNAVVTAVLAVGAWHGLRQRLREWLYDGADNAAPCQRQLDGSLCFAPLRRWVRAWWQGSAWALALDATAHGEHVGVLAVSVLDRGSAIPVAWHVWPANQPGAWRPHLLRLLRLLRPAGPRTMRVMCCPSGWACAGPDCGCGSRWASGPSQGWAGRGSRPGLPSPSAWPATGWCWPWPRSGGWRTALALKRPPSRGGHRHGCGPRRQPQPTAPAWAADNVWSASCGWD